MDKLIEGYLRFRAEVFPQWKDHFRLLAESQSPKVLLITCADSRVVPSMIFQSGPGEMFVCRNAGNVVPPVGERAGGVWATIEYAVEVLRVEHVIVCGHSNCGAVRAAMQPELTKELPLVRPWMRYVGEAQKKGGELLDRSAEEPESEYRHQVRANVVGQLANLCSQEAVAAGIEAGRLQAHGWCYDILTGGVEAYVPKERRFLPLESKIGAPG